MENRIKEVETYFRDCLVNGHFKVVRRDNYLTEVKVDDTYKFTLWTTGTKENLDFYSEFGYTSYMHFELTEMEQQLIWKQLFGEKHKEKTEDRRKRLLEDKSRIEKELEKL